jgi:hypothetical protein
MIRSRVVVVALSALALAAGACSDDGGSTSREEEAGPTIEELPALVAPVMCGAQEDCLGSMLMSLFTGGADCERTVERSFTDEGLENLMTAIDEGRVEYHPARIEACLDRLADLGCDLMVGWYFEECEAALTGTVEEGDDCTLDDECVGDLFCQIEDACPGTCAERGAEGDSCVDAEHCQVGLGCSEAGECVEYGSEGDACTEDAAPCAFPLICLPGDGEEQTCTALDDMMSAEVGEECDPNVQMLCEEGLYCALAGDGWVCNDERSLSGGECVPAFPDQCPEGEFCDTEQTPPTCSPLPADGEPCAPGGLGPTCAPYHVCVGDPGEEECRLLQRNESSCVTDEECYSGNCDEGECVPADACSD